MRSCLLLLCQAVLFFAIVLAAYATPKPKNVGDRLGLGKHRMRYDAPRAAALGPVSAEMISATAPTAKRLSSAFSSMRTRAQSLATYDNFSSPTLTPTKCQVRFDNVRLNANAVQAAQ